MPRHFLRDDDLTPDEQREVLELGMALREDRFARTPLAGPQGVAILFDKPTLRTQVSFSTGVAELGGFPVVVDGRLAQVGVRESVADVTRVLDRQVSAIVWRTFGQERIEEMAAVSRVPVVNALTDGFHPCQILADLLTVAQHRGGVAALAGRRLAYVGDAANNMAASYLLGGVTAGLHVSVAGPQGYLPPADVVARAEQIAAATGGSVSVTTDVRAAVAGADVVAADTWVSMGDEDEAAERLAALDGYRVDEALMSAAADDAIFLHCLPAYRGKEVTAEVIDGPRSVVWDEAENRLHAQKALLTWLLEQR
ncbi:ornithine carbamoyltransferase [Isoptericola cucumis]|uniref:Ornithine carbamoyltransferase n=1 Tax=Isoptericola cucumis TaxID=1776856 RepID=A0ABQ2B7H5_9MICO|nr:ornithine carbamoyltransferase [Isoptericola cucumis]GGI08053.1 ornithine carbamoyltransferase, catabolic [Isoptericola cucumis]